MRLASPLCLALSLGLAACGGKSPVDDSFADLQGLDEKSDTVSVTIGLLGSLEYGQTSPVVTYRTPPRYYAYKFAGEQGDRAVIDVRATGWGDAVAWVLDNDFRTVGFNDDASASTLDAHLEVTLPGNANPDIHTYYIVFRDYDLLRRDFTVSLAKQDFRACERDSDCVKIWTGCCQRFQGTINGALVDEYRASLECADNTICPAIATMPTDDLPICNFATKQCELVDVNNLDCGGHRIMPRACPQALADPFDPSRTRSYFCYGKQQYYDAPGVCRQVCTVGAPSVCDPGAHCADNDMDECVGDGCDGICVPATCEGIAALICPDSLQCIENTQDDCDPEAGGADCGGLCVRR